MMSASTAGRSPESWSNAHRLPAGRPRTIRDGEPACGVVIGIGLNVNLDRDAFPSDLRARATSLRIERDGTTVDRSEVARDLIRRLDHWYDASLSFGCETLNAPWRARSEHFGRIVRVATPAGPRAGRLVDLDVRNGLTLALEREGRPGHPGPSRPRDSSDSPSPRSSHSRRCTGRSVVECTAWSWKRRLGLDRLNLYPVRTA